MGSTRGVHHWEDQPEDRDVLDTRLTTALAEFLAQHRT